ncbi:hypothetical protein AKI39_15150 [Bordetella sp. H567]|uniref:DUF1097 domain-containing protein n=1 Tax=Bordetella sp. H567 TaxID=1697043 RepID=UPI00081C349C|nr:DUF1097 domain-containing protein [Bordetella sp. H567]AOB31746.1 hypothetical protein AKI39_15150 [Bordetella sp. H567]
MKSKEAYTVSIGVLAVADTYLTATILPLPVWVTFIAWASFFILGGGTKGLFQSIVSNLIGVAISSLTLLAIASGGSSPIVVAIAVGIGSALMVQASKFATISVLPAIVWGFASTVATSVATAQPITMPALNNPGLVAAASLVLGGLFGFVSEALGEALTAKDTQLA